MTTPSGKDEALWRDFLEQGGDTWKGVRRSIFRRIPADPRCRMCASPFHGPGAPLRRDQRYAGSRSGNIGKWRTFRVTSAAPIEVAAAAMR